MNRKLAQNWKLPAMGLRFLVIVLLGLGIFFRFVNLDKKVYWQDETLTSLAISGYSVTEVVQQVFTGDEIGVEDLQKYQRLSPEKDLSDTIKALVVDQPEHPPLYYVMVRFWVQCFGDSVAVTRSLSALISLLTFPCAYWLCLELFGSPMTGWIAIALIAASPFHVAYAQEAREYSLWIVMILLSSASFLRAMRRQTRLSWGIYAVTIALGLYSYLFSIFVWIGHGIYVIGTQGFRLSQTFIAYLIASFVGIVTLVPWLLFVITNQSTSSAVRPAASWTAQKVPWLFLVEGWTHNIRLIFYSDFGIGLNLTPLILILVGYSLYFLCRETKKQVWLFILTLIVIPALALILPDLVLGGQRSNVARYLTPCYLGIQLAVAYLLATKITLIYLKWHQKLWQVTMLTLIMCGVISCAISSQAETEWNKASDNSIPPIARIINQYPHPFVVGNAFLQYLPSSSSDVSLQHVLSLSFLLNQKVRLQLIAEPNMPNFSKRFSDVFLFNPSPALRDRLEKKQNPNIEVVYKYSTSEPEPTQFIPKGDAEAPQSLNAPSELWRLRK